jgi:hypothetical protein
MIHQVWRLSEFGDDNLGLACTEQGLLLGRTPLIERRDGRFVVRERSEIEHLLSRAYRAEFPLQRLMAGLATVAWALNADDPCLARITAVHLRIPDLPDRNARDDMEAADLLIKYARDESGGADWNPALHPRTGTPPNPGWFAPTDGGTGETFTWRRSIASGSFYSARAKNCPSAKVHAVPVGEAIRAKLRLLSLCRRKSRRHKEPYGLLTAFWRRVETRSAL